MKDGLQVGDKVEIVSAPKYYEFFKVGDIATLLYQDDDGDWWADFSENKDAFVLDDESHWCIQRDIATCKKV